MTKAEFIADVARRVHMPKTEASYVCEQVFDAMVEAVATSGSVSWPGFGKLEKVARAARKGRNPHTGETIDIPAKNAVTFTPASDFKARIQ